MERTYRIKGKLPQQRLGEELMLFDHEADKVHVLNGTSALVWDCLCRGEDLENAKQGLLAAYNVGEGQNVSLMVQAAVDLLLEQELLTAHTESKEEGEGHVGNARSGEEGTTSTGDHHLRA
jgi:hypothetical protein